MRNILLILIFLMILSSCKEKKESISTEIKLSELQKNQKENISKTIDTTLLFNVWATDRIAPHADFLLTKKEYLTVEKSYQYILKNNEITILFDDENLKGIINHLSKDTLKIKWNFNDSETIYLTYKNGYQYSREEIIETVKFYSDNYGNKIINKDYDFNDLNNKLYSLGEILCDNDDNELFELFLNMTLKSKDSTNEIPAGILCYIYTCKPNYVLDKLNTDYNNIHLINLLKFGFKNSNCAERLLNGEYDKLEKQLDDFNIK